VLGLRGGLADPPYSRNMKAKHGRKSN
jgi:hypothetical protein